MEHQLEHSMTVIPPRRMVIPHSTLLRTKPNPTAQHPSHHFQTHITVLKASVRVNGVHAVHWGAWTIWDFRCMGTGPEQPPTVEAHCQLLSEAPIFLPV